MSVAFVVTSIYCVIGVQLYSEQARLEFGTFARAFFTMLQITTFDNWAAVASKLFAEDGSLKVQPGTKRMQETAFLGQFVRKKQVVSSCCV
eukprot:3377988-Rhodomonas_salina.2